MGKGQKILGEEHLQEGMEHRGLAIILLRRSNVLEKSPLSF